MDAFEFTVAHDLGIGVVDLQGAESVPMTMISSPKMSQEGKATGRRPLVGNQTLL